ncbi:MAG: hypothetical protein AAGU27_21290 [Dehalobacterium sp.]
MKIYPIANSSSVQLLVNGFLASDGVKTPPDAKNSVYSGQSFYSYSWKPLILFDFSLADKYLFPAGKLLFLRTFKHKLFFSGISFTFSTF